MAKVRILNTKTGFVKFVETHIANDAKLMKTYGFIIQDLQENKEIQLPVITIDDNDPVILGFIPEVFDGMAKLKSIEEVREEYFQITGKKAGIKKMETLLKEIQETETKQK